MPPAEALPGTKLMTTSYHTPFTFPDGRIAFKRGRNGAVKYSDYAVGRFIDMARSKPWFKDTVFIIVADHCASSKCTAAAGELPYPGHSLFACASRRMSTPPGQPDRSGADGARPAGLPTQPFHGRSVLHAYPDAGRAFIATIRSWGI